MTSVTRAGSRTNKDMDKANAKARIAELRALIEKANHDYYDLHQPTVGDRDYEWRGQAPRKPYFSVLS